MVVLHRWTALPIAFVLAFGMLNSDIDIRTHQNYAAVAVEADFQSHMLDVISTVYLPPSSKAQRSAFMFCGNALIEFVESHSEPFSERLLFERARALQSRLAPQELIDGPPMSEASCRTPSCGGTVKLETLPLIRPILAALMAP